MKDSSTTTVKVAAKFVKAAYTIKKMKYKVELRCGKCNTVINETTELAKLDLAEEIKLNALANPLLGWCKNCDLKPTPHIIEIKS